jgi:hypothetical protein
MKRVLFVALLTSIASVMAFAQNGRVVPEIDANTASSAVALLSGALMMLRRKR